MARKRSNRLPPSETSEASVLRPCVRMQVGVDFMNPCPRFWRISFPPPDWTSQSPDAKGITNRPSSAQVLDLELFLRASPTLSTSASREKGFCRKKPSSKKSSLPLLYSR